MQAETALRATRRGAQWTSSELELLERRDMTSVEIAKSIGRTYEAVRSMRKKLHRDPRLQRVVNFSGREGRL